jgi:hypothetical protein
MRDRCLFVNVPLPAGMDVTKTVDWSAVDSTAPATGAKRKAAPAKKRKAATASGTNRSPMHKKAAPAKKAPAKRKATAKKQRARG